VWPRSGNGRSGETDPLAESGSDKESGAEAVVYTPAEAAGEMAEVDLDAGIAAAALPLLLLLLECILVGWALLLLPPGPSEA
jgi:hypothetical protein